MSRFSQLSDALAAKGAHNPDALAAYIGAKKYGHAGFLAMAAKGRAKKAAHQAEHAGRSEQQEWGYSLLRSYALEDIEIQRGGDGRVVTAYAAMFGQPYEVRDQHGWYMEEIERSAFNRTISHGNALRSAVCLYNHGYTVTGSPDAMLSIPLGTPLDIRAEPKGLLTVTRYNKTDLADQVLESIRNGDIKSQSFRGRTIRSTPERVPRVRAGSPLPHVMRNELGLSDYGPTPVAVNKTDMEFAVRSWLEHLEPAKRSELIRQYVPSPDEVDNATPDPGPGAEDPPAEALRSAADIARRIRVEQILRSRK